MKVAEIFNAKCRVNLKRWYVYAHIADEQLIYVGMGRGIRAFDLVSRVVKHREAMLKALSAEVAIIRDFDRKRDAMRFERELIAELVPRYNVSNPLQKRLDKAVCRLDTVTGELSTP